ncbi:putative transmembrane domain-containing protein [Cryptosporidium parvum]
MEDWLPEWVKIGNYELREIYIPKSKKELGICQYNILTSGNKLKKDHEWFLENRIEYSRKNGYCYFHLDLSFGEVRNPHYWRYIGIIKLYKKVQGLLSDHKEHNYLVLYMDSDTMFSRFSVRIEDFHEKMKDSFLYLSVDDNCELQHYLLNVGVLLMSLRRLETLIFCIQVLALQKTQSILSYSSEWSRSGLNDQNIVISVLNDTGRLDIENIQSYCLRKKNSSWLDNEDQWINLNYSKQNKGVVVVPSLYLNQIIRMDYIMKSSELKTNLWLERSWIIHFSGSNRLEQCFMIQKLCLDRIRKFKTKYNHYFKECPEKMEELMTKNELKKIKTLFSLKMDSSLDPNNYIGQNYLVWIKDLEQIDLGIRNLSNRYSILIKRIIKLLKLSRTRQFTQKSKRELVGAVLQFLENSNKFGLIFEKLYLTGISNRRTIKYEAKNAIEFSNIFNFFSLLNKCPNNFEYEKKFTSKF